MQQLLYRSIARDEEFSESDLDILLTALNFNHANGITGFLWRGRGQFFQALHGPEEHLQPLLQRITDDPRHHGLEVLLTEDAPKKTPFPDWAMGYDYLSEDMLDIALDDDGERPELSREKCHEIWGAMVAQAINEADWGTGFPYARKSKESHEAWVARLTAVRNA